MMGVWMSLMGLAMLPPGKGPLPPRPFNRISDVPPEPEEETEAQRLAREKRERKNRKRAGK